jgi:cysteinyl-tRNA synthetase
MGNMQQIMEMLVEIKVDQARMEAKRQSGREDLKGMMAEMNANQAKVAKLEEMLARMREVIKSGNAEMKSTVNAFQEKMAASIANRKDDRNETTACNEATETVPEPGMMQSAEEHQDTIHNKDAAVMPVGEPRKWRRVQNLASERRQNRKKRTRGTLVSRRKSAVARRKVTPRARWYGARESSGIFGHRKIMDLSRN